MTTGDDRYDDTDARRILAVHREAYVPANEKIGAAEELLSRLTQCAKDLGYSVLEEGGRTRLLPTENAKRESALMLTAVEQGIQFRSVIELPERWAPLDYDMVTKAWIPKQPPPDGGQGNALTTLAQSVITALAAIKAAGHNI